MEEVNRAKVFAKVKRADALPLYAESYRLFHGSCQSEHRPAQRLPVLLSRLGCGRIAPCKIKVDSMRSCSPVALRQRAAPALRVWHISAADVLRPRSWLTAGAEKTPRISENTGGFLEYFEYVFGISARTVYHTTKECTTPLCPCCKGQAASGGTEMHPRPSVRRAVLDSGQGCGERWLSGVSGTAPARKRVIFETLEGGG